MKMISTPTVQKRLGQLMKVFPCAEIAWMRKGGGIAVMEALHDKDKIPEGEASHMACDRRKGKRH